MRVLEALGFSALVLAGVAGVFLFGGALGVAIALLLALPALVGMPGWVEVPWIVFVAWLVLAYAAWREGR